VWKQIPFAANDFAEDLDWGKRVLEAGWKIAYEPSAFVIHSHNRSLDYEFKRTYLCHQKLYSLFQVRTVPSRRRLVISVIKATFMDWAYACRHESRFWKCVSLLASVPILNSVAIYAQYRGARDQKLLRGRKIEGI
jgi:rhamnosyltransferase